MIRADAEPIAHVSPYKRIEIGAQPKQTEPKYVEGAHWDAFWRAMLPVQNVPGTLTVPVWLTPIATGSFDLTEIDLTVLNNAI